VTGILAIMFLMLPKGFKDDLSLVGNGTVSVVLTHDKNLLDSTRMMELMNAVRSDYQGTVEFLAVDLATPVGQGFVREQLVGPVTLVFFGAEGERRQVLDSRVNEQQLRETLDQLLADSGS
jgi:hypothetical protein